LWYDIFLMEKRMARLSVLAVALVVAAIGAAQAAPPNADPRYVVADSQNPAGTNVAEGIFINPKPVQATEQRRAKPPRIWLSMGF
jgi:hypothetical protein